MIDPISSGEWANIRSATSMPMPNVPEKDATRDAFRDFVGQTMFGQMLQSMRSTVGKPAYFHGGRGEEVFQQQLDQVMVEKISDASASTVADPMYELFRLQRSQ